MVEVGISITLTKDFQLKLENVIILCGIVLLFLWFIPTRTRISLGMIRL